MSYDDKLKKAIEDIRKILKEYDIAGTIALVSKTHAEYLYHFPAWSEIQWNEAGDSLRVKSEKKNFPTKGLQEQRLSESVHIVMQNRDIAAQTLDMFDTVYEALRKHFTIHHKSFSGFEPHKPDKSSE